MGIEKLIIGTKAFNKAGYRLAYKKVGQSIPKSVNIQGAVSMDTVCIEGKNGIKRLVYSFKDDNGKLLCTQHNYSDSPNIIKRFYEWFKPQQRSNITARELEKIDPNAFENHGVRIVQQSVDKNSKKVLQRKYSVIDVNDMKKTVTRTDASREFLEEGETICNDKTSIVEIVNGKKIKGLFLKSEVKLDEIPNVTEANGFGINEKEIEYITTNPYFNAMFKTPEDMIVAIKPQIYTEQGIDSSTKLFASKNISSWGVYSHADNSITLNRSLFQNADKGFILNTLSHEARHRWQHQFVDKLEKGLLADPKEIELAKTFKKNIENYIDYNDAVAKYGQKIGERLNNTQPIEVDAQNIGYSVNDRHNEFVLGHLKNVFTNASIKTLGI